MILRTADDVQNIFEDNSILLTDACWSMQGHCEKMSLLCGPLCI